MISIKRLPKRQGFPQRHFTFREKTPFLKGLDIDLEYRRSSVNLDLIKEDLFEFDRPRIDVNSIIQQDSNLKLSIHLAAEAFRLPNRVSMIHLNDLFDYPLQIWSSSPGLPWKTRGYLTKKEVVDDPHNRQMIRWFWHQTKYGRKTTPSDCCAFVRSHLTKDVDKVRAVWGYPLNMALGEAVFAVPLIEAYQEDSNNPLAYGYETAIGGMKRIINESQHCKFFSGIDFKGFDKSVQADLIYIAFDILMRNIDFVNYRDYGKADASRMMRMWDYIVSYFINTPIRLCTGERYQKSNGVASGSYFTQMIDSVVNYILITWIYLEQTGSPPKYLKVMGDDSLAGGDFQIDLDWGADIVARVGMRLNVNKSGVSRDINRLKFLGFEINYGEPLKSFDEWVALLCLPERFDKSWDDVATRALGLFYANSGVNEKFDFLAREIIALRHFKISMDRGFARYLNLMGIDYLAPDLPTARQFRRRLKMM